MMIDEQHSAGIPMSSQTAFLDMYLSSQGRLHHFHAMELLRDHAIHMLNNLIKGGIGPMHICDSVACEWRGTVNQQLHSHI